MYGLDAPATAVFIIVYFFQTTIELSACKALLISCAFIITKDGMAQLKLLQYYDMHTVSRSCHSIGVVVTTMIRLRSLGHSCVLTFDVLEFIELRYTGLPPCIYHVYFIIIQAHHVPCTLGQIVSCSTIQSPGNC